MTANRHLITTGQFFTLLFVARAGLTMIYSAEMSGLGSLSGFLLPLLIMVPLGIVLMLPAACLCRKSFCPLRSTGSAAPSPGVRLLFMAYAGFFLLSALYYIASLYVFLLDALPEGVSPQVIIVLLVIGCTYASSKGIEAGARTSLIVMVLIVLSVLLVFCFLYQDYSPERLPEIGELAPASVGEGIVFLISRLGGFAGVLLLSESIRGRLIKGGIIWLTLSSVVLGLLIILFSGTVGDYLSTKSFQVFRVIDGSWILQKSEPLFIAATMCSSFIGIYLFMLSASVSVDRCLKRTGALSSSLWIGAILTAAVLLIPKEIMSIIVQQKLPLALLTLCFLTLIPSAVLVSKPITSILWRRRKNHRPPAGIISLFLIAATIVNLCACSPLQLNRRLIIQGIGIDRVENGYTLTLITLNTDHPEQDNSVSLLSSQGITVDEAISKAEAANAKRILLEQCLFVMLNESASQQGADTLSALTGSNDMPKTAGIFVTSGAAQSTLISAIGDYGYTSEEISLLCDDSIIKQSIPHRTLMELISAGYKNEDIIVPIIDADPENRSLTVRQDRGALIRSKGTA